MIKIRGLTPALRKELRRPLGLLIRGSFDETMKKLKRLVSKEKPPWIISVGDVVSENMIKHGIHPHVWVVDHKVMRKFVTPLFIEGEQVLHVKNPSGALTEDAWFVMREALKTRRRTKILVDGEEDLFTMVAVLCAPQNSLVVYGQPEEGIVVVKVTEEKREKVRLVVEAMNPPYEKLK